MDREVVSFAFAFVCFILSTQKKSSFFGINLTENCGSYKKSVVLPLSVARGTACLLLVIDLRWVCFRLKYLVTAFGPYSICVRFSFDSH